MIIEIPYLKAKLFVVGLVVCLALCILYIINEELFPKYQESWECIEWKGEITKGMDIYNFLCSDLGKYDRCEVNIIYNRLTRSYQDYSYFEDIMEDCISGKAICNIFVEPEVTEYECTKWMKIRELR